MVEAFWNAVDFLVKLAGTAAILGGIYWIWQYPPQTDDRALIFAGLNVMFISFIVMIWRYGK
jgi:hypothetical protein